MMASNCAEHSELSIPELEVLNTLQELQALKRKLKVFPDYVLDIELRQKIGRNLSKELRCLFKRGLIEYHTTVNGMVMFDIICS